MHTGRPLWFGHITYKSRAYPPSFGEPKAISSRYGQQGSPESFRQQDFDQGFDPVVLGDAVEALGRVGTGDASSQGTGSRGNTAIPIQFKELMVLTRRGKLCIRIGTC